MATVNDRFVVVNGPRKEEVLNLTAVSDEDTVETLIQNPEFAQAVITSDGASNAFATNVSISGKTLTLNNATLAGTTSVVVTVYGF